MSRVIVAVVLAVFACSAFAKADSPVHLTVTVVDADGVPIRAVAVTVRPLNDAPYTILTGDKGTCSSFPLVPGFYRVTVQAAGYRTAHRSFEVTGATQSMAWRVSLSRQLRTIVNMKSSSGEFTETYHANRAFGRLFTNLADLMNALGNANVSVSSSGSLLGAAMDGKDPSLTQTSFNGVEVESAASLGAIDVNALSAARIDDEKSALDLTSIGPAPFPVYEAEGMLGGDAFKNVKMTAQGTAGTVGYAAALGAHAQGAPLSGQTFLDTSGFTYKHIASYSSRSVDLRIDVPLPNDWTFRLQYAPRTYGSLPLLDLSNGTLISGYGPGANRESGNSEILGAGLVGEKDGWSIKASLDNFYTTDNGNFSQRYVSGEPAPFYQQSSSDERIMHVFAVRGVGAGTLNLNASYDNIYSDSALAVSHTFPPALVMSSRRLHGDITYIASPYRGHTLQGTVTVGRAVFPNPQTAYGLSFKATQAVSSTAEVYLDASVGSKLGMLPDPGQFSIPSLAQFDCSGREAVATGPNDFPSVPMSRSFRAGFSSNSQASSYSIVAYDEDYKGIVLSNAIVPAQNEPTGFLPPGYISAVVTSYADSGCTGEPAVYIEHDVAGVGVQYRGVDLSVGRKISHRTTVQARMSLRDATLQSADVRLVGGPSPYVIGHQLPNVPYYDASLSASYQISPATELLGNASIMGANNANNLPAYALLTVGGVARLSPIASLNLIVTNATKQHAIGFISPSGARWLPAANGEMLPTFAMPLVQPQIFLGIDFRWEHQPSF